MAEVEEGLPSTSETLSSNPAIKQKKKSYHIRDTRGGLCALGDGVEFMVPLTLGVCGLVSIQPLLLSGGTQSLVLDFRYVFHFDSIGTLITIIRSASSPLSSFSSLLSVHSLGTMPKSIQLVKIYNL